MSRYTNNGFIYNQAPLDTEESRSEDFLIEILGNWIPENEVIIYGLIGSPEGEELFKIRELTTIDRNRLYRETCYLNSIDLIRFLASTEPDELDASLTLDEIARYIAIAWNNYQYFPCSELMLQHAIIEIAKMSFVKSITLLYPWELREIDKVYLQTIIPEKDQNKFHVLSGSLIDAVASKENGFYSTIILNSLNDLNFLIDNKVEYKTDKTFFLLRNHSGNTSYQFDENNKIIFKEIGNPDLLQKTVDIATAIPISGVRVGRYEPSLFEDAHI